MSWGKNRIKTAATAGVHVRIERMGSVSMIASGTQE
jgi:hypothetical protein